MEAYFDFNFAKLNFQMVWQFKVQYLCNIVIYVHVRSKKQHHKIANILKNLYKLYIHIKTWDGGRSNCGQVV